MHLAIDYSISNGEVDDPSSLHYVDPENPDLQNPYEQAIRKIGEIMEPNAY